MSLKPEREEESGVCSDPTDGGGARWGQQAGPAPRPLRGLGGLGGPSVQSEQIQRKRHERAFQKYTSIFKTV